MMVLEKVIIKIPWLPNKFEPEIAYLIVFAVAFLICWRGNFNFFSSLNFTFAHDYEGWIYTAALLSGGSAFVKASFGMISSIPQVISNVYSTATGFLSGGGTTTTATPGASSNPNLPP
jgi:hypothetical protein